VDGSANSNRTAAQTAVDGSANSSGAFA